MSRDLNYIGMDVHKEATVIAVLNGSGKLVMESIVETKASSILHRGENRAPHKRRKIPAEPASAAEANLSSPCSS
jgi:hypothetical protein